MWQNDGCDGGDGVDTRPSARPRQLDHLAGLGRLLDVLGLLLGFFLAEQLLHYYCDRCLFRFRDPGVRKAAAPLL